MQASPWKQSKESIERHLLKDRANLISDQEKYKHKNYQCHFTWFAGFKKESTQDSDGYNLALRAVNLFDMLDLNI